MKEKGTKGAGAKGEFKFPRWKTIIGDVHIMSDWELQYDLQAIEEFANNMLNCGWRLVSVRWGSRFSFVPCAPGEYICRTVSAVTANGFFDRKKAWELTELLTADRAGIVPQENTWGTQIGIIALRPSALGSFEITSDIDSRISEYEARMKFGNRLGALFSAVGFFQFLAGGVGLVHLFSGGESTTYYFLSLSIIWFVLAYYYYRPVSRYKEILKRLYAERNISET